MRASATLGRGDASVPADAPLAREARDFARAVLHYEIAGGRELAASGLRTPSSLLRWVRGVQFSKQLEPYWHDAVPMDPRERSAWLVLREALAAFASELRALRETR